MTLTEQWEKGELPDGFYYFKMPDGAIEIASEYRLIRYSLTKDADKIEVLAPVPSYEEWQRIFHYAGKYEHEYTSCVMEYENLKQENQQLKELLKTCKEMLEEYQYSEGDYTIGDNLEIDTSLLLKKIDNSIGE